MLESTQYSQICAFVGALKWFKHETWVNDDHKMLLWNMLQIWRHKLIIKRILVLFWLNIDHKEGHFFRENRFSLELNMLLITGLNYFDNTLHSVVEVLFTLRILGQKEHKFHPLFFPLILHHIPQYLNILC